MASVNRPLPVAAEYSGMEISELKRLKEMEQELAQFKRIVADLTLQNRVLKDVIEKSSEACTEAGAGGLCQVQIQRSESAAGLSHLQYQQFGLLLSSAQTRG